MTLAEYLNQENPVRMPEVILKDGEFITHGRIKDLRFIEIPAIYERFKTSGNYILKDGCTRLFTHDEHGNTDKLSCFHIINQ